MTRHLGVALLAVAALWTSGRARAACNNTGMNQGCNYDCDCDCGYVCEASAVPKHCILSKTNPTDPGHCDVNFTSCACRVGFGSTINQTCVAGSCTPTWAELDDAGALIYADAGPPPVPECIADVNCGCGNHCEVVNPPLGDGGFHCVSWADAGGPVGGICACYSNMLCIDSDCGCPNTTCTCDSHGCDDGGGNGVCHPGDGGTPPPPDAGKDCTEDVECGNTCGQVCSHAMEYWLCLPASSGDPGWCNGNLGCPCPSDLCDTTTNHCGPPGGTDAGPDAGPDAGHDAGTTDDAGSTTGGTSGGNGSSGCGSAGNGAAGLGVLALVGSALLLSRRRRLAGGR